MLEDKTSEPSKRHALKALLTNILEGSTIMPFRWSANKYLCFYCCCSFVDSSKLKEHTRDEHRDANLRNALRNIRDFGHSRIKLDVSEISCKRCLKSIPSLQSYLDHSVEAHDFNFDKDIVNYLLSFKLSDDGMCCLECGQGFRFFGPLITHVHKYHNSTNAFLCEMCGQGFIAKSTLDSHVRMMHSNADMQCDKCNKIFPSQYILNSHFSKTHRVETFKCSKCPEILKSRYLKKRHLAIVHDVKSTQFFCEHCDKMFTTKSALVQHVARVHLKEKTFACEVCGFKVFSRELLRQHMVKHDDARPFQCEFCKKSFQRKKTLDFHRRIHTNDRRYACKECGKAFVQVASLKLHLRVHHSIGNDNN